MKKLLFFTVLFAFFSANAQVTDSEKMASDKTILEKDFFFWEEPLYVEVSKYEKQADTSKQRILLIGDSMVGGLSFAMQDYCDYNGHDFLAVAWESSQTKWYGKTDTLKFFIKKFQPTYIFILLGANETYLSKNYKKRRGEYIEKILKDLDSLRFVWIGPPNWDNDTDLNTVLRDYVGYDRFFTSYKISLNNPKFKHWRDGRHPALSADRLWMDTLAIWVKKYSRYPIKLDKPPQYSSKPKSNLKILKPLPKSKR